MPDMLVECRVLVNISLSDPDAAPTERDNVAGEVA
jgi:hypothetical protein